MSDLREENRRLRERVAQLEQKLRDGVDPIIRALGDHASPLLSVVDLNGSLLTVPATQPTASNVVRSVFDQVNPEHHAMMRETFARVAATGRPETYECVGLNEQGEPGHTFLTKVVPIGEADRIHALLLIPHDITERVALEQSLRERDQELRLAFETTGIGLWRWDVASGVIAWNDRLRAIYGVAETPTDYAAYLALVHPDDRELVNTTVGAAVSTGVYRTFEHRVVNPSNGSERWLLAVGSVLNDAAGKAAVVMGGAVDITEQKQVEMRVHRAERVESVGQLTAGIAHNFNNLLAVILPNIEVAACGASEAQHPHLRAALDASLQARDLVRSLLALTRRDDKRARAPAHLTEVVKRVEALCRVTFPREIALSSHIDGHIGHVAIPTADLEQTLLNLLLNARDALEADSARPRREIRLWVDRVVRPADQQDCARVRIEDTGVGMTEDVCKRVFDAFFTTKPPHKGSGLGLANVALHVRDAQGTIECQSKPGVGTTFTLTLPILADAPPAPRDSTTPFDPASGAVVLIVDDEPLVRNVVRHLLQSDGCRVLEASSSHEARSILRRRDLAVDVVILDQSMPHETGVEALPSIRELTDAPVVLFTGMAPVVPAGFAALLEKPATPADLRRVIRQVYLERLRVRQKANARRDTA